MTFKKDSPANRDRYKPAYFFVLVLAAVMSAAAGAHQQQQVFTTVLFNPRSQNVEVAHRIYLHDAEHVAKQISKKDYDLLSSNNARQAFSRYVSARFSLAFASLRALPLVTLGEEVEGKFFWVYQELPLPQDFASRTSLNLELQHRVLLDFFPKQKNWVNVEVNGLTRTWLFERDNSTQSLQLKLLKPEAEAAK